MPGRKCLVVRKVDATLRDSCFALFKDIISQWKIYDQCKINKTDFSKIGLKYYKQSSFRVVNHSFIISKIRRKHGKE